MMPQTTHSLMCHLAVSTVLGQENSQPTGSLQGGTTLYMKVQGLDQTASNNAVYIRKYLCVISDKGVNGSFMNCKTTKPDLNDENLSGLSMRLAGKPDSVCTFNKEQRHFTYSEDYTPILKYVTPRSNYPQQYSTWRAKLTVSSKTPIFLDGQFMGTNRCDRFNIKNKYPESIDPNDDFVACQVAEIEAINTQLTQGMGIRGINKVQRLKKSLMMKLMFQRQKIEKLVGLYPQQEFYLPFI